MQCQTIQRLLVEYVKGELDHADEALVEAHVTDCARCRADAETLAHGFNALACLPVYAVTYDLNTVEEETRRRQARATLRIWSVVVAPIAACMVAAVLLTVFIFRPFPQQAIANNRPLPPKPKTTIPSPQPSPPILNTASPQPDNRLSLASKREQRPDLPRVSAMKPEVDRKPEEQTPAQQRIIEQYVDVLALCMRQSDASRGEVFCAIQPITTAKASDLPVADTLTASIYYTLKNRYVGYTVSRLPPMGSSAISPNGAADLTAAHTPSSPDDYLLTGRLERTKAGYVLSLYAVNRHTQEIVFDGGHPILLPEDLLPQIQAAGTRRDVLAPRG
ncbi:MAG: hypothetical protein BWY76_01115 [bacterium ADurb.Bin429]|nr:MAG: hypothetical protein BWY76_01115 [bacterium ADurb.Bin429]